MCQSANHPASGATRQFGIRVEGDDVTYFEKIRQLSCLCGKTIELAPQQVVEIHQLAPFAFPSHPQPFARVIDAMAMEQKKGNHLLLGVLFIEPAYQIRCSRD